MQYRNEGTIETNVIIATTKRHFVVYKSHFGCSFLIVYVQWNRSDNIVCVQTASEPV